MQMLVIFVSMLLATLFLGSDKRSSAIACVSGPTYTHITFNVMNKKTLGFVTGYASAKRPKKQDLAWSTESSDEGWRYSRESTKMEFIEFLSTLKATGLRRRHKWDAMYATYDVGERGCVLAMKMDLNKIKANYGEVVGSHFIVYINGFEFYTMVNPYPFFTTG